MSEVMKAAVSGSAVYKCRSSLPTQTPEVATRILVLNNLYPPHHLGGYELSCRDVVRRWREAGHDVLVLTTGWRVPGVADPADESPDHVRRTLRFYWNDHEIVSPPLRERFLIERSNQRVLRDAITAFRPDVASLWHMGAMSMGLITALERTLPIVAVICDDWMIYGPEVDAWSRSTWRRPGLARLIEATTRLPSSRPGLQNAAFCFISEWTATRARDRSPLKPRISTIVYNGIDTVDFPVARRELRPWRWQLLYAGRIEERKGVHVAVQSLSLLPREATLTIDGRADPAYLERLRAIAAAEDVGDRVSFADTPRAELRHRYAAADAVVFPVLWDEPFGLVPVEAMASGTCVVATATGGSREFLVDGGNALVVRQDDPRSLADALLRLSADDSLRARLTQGGAVTAEELTVDRFADVLTTWHEAAITGFDGARPPERERIPDVLRRRGVIPPG
jgi:glycosyltransferase involved in cell wall biosynthesis